MENKTHKILLVDDHQIVIEGLKTILKDEPNINIVAEASNGQDALTILTDTPIDLVITDLKMPSMSGIELAENIKKKYPSIKVLALTMFKDREFIKAIINTEAEGYILKSSGKPELLRAINHIMDDGTFYDKEVLALLKEDSKPANTKQNSKTEDLSEREIETIRLICKEYSSDEIAKKLNISRHTVDSHRKSIFKKTGVKNLVGLIRFAIQNELIKGL